jgi:hypothetical protein
MNEADIVSSDLANVGLKSVQTLPSPLSRPRIGRLLSPTRGIDERPQLANRRVL